VVWVKKGSELVKAVLLMGGYVPINDVSGNGT
jgi:hypothetical protein